MSQQIPMIDVSSNNHTADQPIDWPRVKAAGFGAVIVKCSEGVDYVSPWAKPDGDGAHAAGLLVGYYHFAHPGHNHPEMEAASALGAIAGLPIALGLALDLEVTEGHDWRDLAKWAQQFHQQVINAGHHSPLYVNDYFLANLPGAPWGVRLWLAQTARPRREVWAWQRTTPAQVPGIQGPVDVGWLHPDA